MATIFHYGTKGYPAAVGSWLLFFLFAMIDPALADTWSLASPDEAYDISVSIEMQPEFGAAANEICSNVVAVSR